jgi:hypothetical protein
MTSRTYKFRLYPSPSQEKNLFGVMDAAQGLDNMALEARQVFSVGRVAVRWHRETASSLPERHQGGLT